MLCCTGLIQSVSIVYREDLDLKNHLAGHQRKLMKVAFDHTQALMEVRGELMPTIARNRASAKRCDAYSVLSSLSSASASAAVRPQPHPVLAVACSAGSPQAAQVVCDLYRVLPTLCMRRCSQAHSVAGVTRGAATRHTIALLVH